MKHSALVAQPFREHLTELRSRLLWILISLFLGSLIGYWYKDLLLSLLLQPLHKPVFYSSPTGAFEFVFKICLFFGMVVSLPVILYHGIKFLEPMLPPKKHLSLARMVLASCILMILGISFAYFLSLPTALHFFNEFSSKQVQSLISTDEYLSFIMNYLLGFGIIFQLPLLLFLVNQITPLTVSWLLQQERYVIIISFVIGLLLTPDPLNQTIMALPLIFLYQISIICIWMVNRKKKKNNENT